MKEFPGTPGTLMSFILRFMQFVFAAASIVSMSSRSSFYNITAFWFLIASMYLQMFWSFLLALFDAFSLVKKKAFHDHVLVGFFLVGDWGTATFSLAAASASAGVTVLLSDLREECQNCKIAVAYSYMTWVTIAISSLIMLWILAAGSVALMHLLAENMPVFSRFCKNQSLTGKSAILAVNFILRRSKF